MSSELDIKTILAPADAWDAGTPRINGPAVHGASPGKDFLHLIPVTGERPFRFSVEGLPAGLSLNAVSGQILGRAAKEGEYPVLVKAENRHGKAESEQSVCVTCWAIRPNPLLIDCLPDEMTEFQKSLLCNLENTLPIHAPVQDVITKLKEAI